MNTQLFAGKFEIQGEIAKGQTGTIYYGYDLELRQEVAIKIYHSHINGRLIRGKAFIEKSKPLLRLEHPNLIKIFKVEEVDETPVVFMEFYDAPSLQQVIHQEGPLPMGRMLLLAREIAEVLVHTHFQGIIHGTLHPGHVLVGPQGQIKVMDLGLSWILMDILSNCDVDLLRPLPYLLPEIAKGELLNVSSDLYCLGFMMYDMLTKRVPYSGLPKTSIMGKLAFDQADPDFDFPDGVPEAIRELIRQMTRNKSQHRLQDATHVLTILNQQLAKIAPEVWSPPVAPSEPRQVKEKEKAVIESPAPQPHAQPPDPTPNQLPVVNRPKHSPDYQGIHRATFRKKLGFTLGIILVLMGITMGYWYRELLEIPVSSIPPELTNPNRPLLTEPAPPIDSSATTHTQIPIATLQTTPKTEEEQSFSADGPQNIGTSSLVPRENSSLKSPVSGQQPDTETNPVPEPSKASRPQDSSSRTNHPFAKKNLTPFTQPAPESKPSSTITKTGQETSDGTTKEPISHLELPSESDNETTKSIQESTPASLKTELIESFESKELKELLDSVDASETVTTLPTDPQIPLSTAPSASSSSESSQ
jgi:serine/threonine protein kinase